MIPPRLVMACLMMLILNACAKQIPETQIFNPISSFSGRILVMSQTHRFQLAIDWKSSGEQGEMRLTHSTSGRIIHVVWDKGRMRMQDNTQQGAWQDLSEQDLIDMGVIFPPWVLARIFLGDMPSSMKTKDNRLWKGHWENHTLRVSWASEQQKVDLKDVQHGRRVVVMFDE